MGLLLQPEFGKAQITEKLIKNATKLSITFYFLSVLSLFCLIYPDLNSGTHFSENSLLPGLVNSEFEDERSVQRYFDEFHSEIRQEGTTDSAKSWLLAKLKQFNFDVYSQNFTLLYPLSDSQFTGKNIYGILRAPRAARTESIVISAPFRQFGSLYPSTAASIAYLLAIAKFASTKKYWAKDLIFLITDHEQLGAKAWLEAYHESDNRNSYLRTGDLEGRAGSIQAAINLEFHDLAIDKIDVKMIGLNGRLPNLDFVNLAFRMCLKQNIPHSLKNYLSKNIKNPFKNYLYSSKNLFSFVMTQASNVPDGNHGIFLSFGIDAITLKGSVRKSSVKKQSILDIGKMIEGCLRSLNNLLERFHQSVFFYLLITPNRFISIGVYIVTLTGFMIPICLKVLNLWASLYSDQNSKNTVSKDTNLNFQQIEDNLRLLKGFSFHYLDHVNLTSIVLVLLFGHMLPSLLLLYLPDFIVNYCNNIFPFSNNETVFYAFLIAVALLMSFVFPFNAIFRLRFPDVILLKILLLLEFGTLLLAVGIMNISLGILLSVLYIPLVLMWTCNATKCSTGVAVKLAALIFHPATIEFILIGIYAFFAGPNESSTVKLMKKTHEAFKQSLVLSLVDWKLYGNIKFPLVTSFLIPFWNIFWYLSFRKDDMYTFHFE